MSFSGFLAVYVLGGLTFIPLVLIAVLLHAYLTLPIREESDTLDETSKDGSGRPRYPELETSDLDNLPPELKKRTHVPDVAAGYFAVCREYVPGGINGKPPERTTPAGAVVATESPSVYQSMYRSIFDRNKTLSPTLDAANGKSKKARNVFYVVLRLGYLMLYDDSEQLEVRHVISLAHYDVDIYSGGEPIPEGELWIKRNCIRLSQKSQLQLLASDSKPYCLFSENCSEKEDFYHAMLQSQDRSEDSVRRPPRPLGFDAPDLVKLVQQLHASEENMHTRWINALIGRLFLALYKTSEIENFIRTKITKKIARVPKPALISSINLQKINTGHLPPFITNPRLRELTVDGDLTVEADISYKGEFRIEISAIARIDLGPRFKAREVTLVLATILKKLEGHILVRIKPPPSNRLWITFETAPKMELSLEPIVSSRQITYGVILRAIENRIREVVSETLVLPNWDDMPFSDTILHPFRGGIWADRPTEDNSAESRDEVREQSASNREKGSESDDSDLQLKEVATKEAAKSMPNLASRRKSSSGKSLAVSVDGAEAEAVGISTATDVKARAKPRQMRSGSFATVAGPIVNMDPANASSTDSEVRERRQDAASVMMAVSKSPPTSPAHTPVGSPSRPVPIHQANRRRSTSPGSMNAPEDDQAENRTDSPALTSSGTVPLSISAESTGSPSSSTTNLPQMKPKHASSLSLPRNAFGSADKRQAFNQSINSATAAAKKWFVSKQNPDSPSSPIFGALSRTQTSTTASGDSTKEGNGSLASQSTSSLQTPGQPIGRGQPLPPPGTPLPGPPKKSGWAVPAASTFANLTKRKSMPMKSQSSLESNDASIITPSSQQSEGSEETSTIVEKVASRRKSSTRSNSGAEVPPPLPARRQRLSNARPANGSPARDEGLFVVAAPLADTSAPTSPAIERKSFDDKQLLDEGQDEVRDCEEGVFEGMDIDDEGVMETSDSSNRQRNGNG